MGRRDGIALTILLTGLVAIGAAWGYTSGVFLATSDYGEPVDAAYDRGRNEFGDEAWWREIKGFFKQGGAMQVATELDINDVDACNTIYERIWSQPNFLKTWHTGKLLIFDHQGGLLCGGAA